MGSLYAGLQWVLIALYLAAPPALLVLAGIRTRRDGGTGEAVLRHFLPASATLLGGIAIGLGLALVYAQLVAGSLRSVSLGQVVVSAYMATALLALLKGADSLLQIGLRQVRRRRGWTTRPWGALALFARVVFLVLVLLPFSMAAIMSFRPKVIPATDPFTEYRLPFERVTFTAADGTRLAGWWIPADPALRLAEFPEQTLLLVHGLGGGKADMLGMASAMHDAGFHVLTIDLRAHGESGGQFTGFGAAEVQDVEAAVEWIRVNRPEAARRLVGLAPSMGAAAMLAARGGAEHHSPFDAMAVLGTYDDLGRLGRELMGRQFLGPLGTIAGWVALPVASAHAGRDLARFRPAEAAREAWPCPILVVHGQNDEIIPTAAGRRLYAAILEPKRAWWVRRADHNRILSDPEVIRVILEFYGDALRVPMEGVV